MLLMQQHSVFHTLQINGSVTSSMPFQHWKYLCMYFKLQTYEKYDNVNDVPFAGIPCLRWHMTKNGSAGKFAKLEVVENEEKNSFLIN